LLATNAQLKKILALLVVVVLLLDNLESTARIVEDLLAYILSATRALEMATHWMTTEL